MPAANPPDTLEIDVDFLLPRDGAPPTDDQRAFAKLARKFTSDPTAKTLAINSRYNSGKTHFLRRLIKKHAYERVLFITYRQSLARDIRRNFRSLGFANYLDAHDDPSVWNSPRLIVQLDSLRNVMLKSDDYLMTGEWNGRYDLIVLDESESLLAHLDEGTMEGKAIETFEFMDGLLSLSSKIVCLDGDLSGRTLEFARTYGPLTCVTNRNQVAGKSIKIVRDADDYRAILLGDLDRFHQEDANFRIAVACQAACQVEDLRLALQASHPHLKVITLTGQDSGETKRQFFENVNETFGNANVLIYSPVIESGVDITVPVRKVYGKLSCKSNCPRAFLQMLARCRNVADGEVVLLADPAFVVNRNFSFWHYHEVEALNRDSLGLNEARLQINGDTMSMGRTATSKRKIISVYNATEKT